MSMSFNKPNAIRQFLSGEKGQRFFNFAYSIGAAIVIWGALFKILHLPGGNFLLAVGMGTEVLMFILTAFDSSFAASHSESERREPENKGHEMPEEVVSSLAECLEQMKMINANIASLNAIYELNAHKHTQQALDADASQMARIREAYERSAQCSLQYCEEAEKMTQYMRELNSVYEKMLKAMSANAHLPIDKSLS